MSKVCPRCKTDKPSTEYYIRRVVQLDSYCKACRSDLAGMYQRKIPARTKHLRDRYGLTPEEVDDMIRAQGGGCAICGSTSRMVVDHDHVTGELRGVLCHNCNVLLGHARDDVEILQKAIDYLGR